nr:SDR family oxidoreductase [Streptomyces spinosisporus]
MRRQRGRAHGLGRRRGRGRSRDRSRGTLLALHAVTALGDDDSIGAYILAKRANLVRVQAAALAWNQRGARINTVSPGVISTAMAKAESESDSGGHMLKMLDACGAGRSGTPGEIADAVAFLSGPQASRQGVEEETARRAGRGVENVEVVDGSLVLVADLLALAEQLEAPHVGAGRGLGRAVVEIVAPQADGDVGGAGRADRDLEPQGAARVRGGFGRVENAGTLAEAAGDRVGEGGGELVSLLGARVAEDEDVERGTAPGARRLRVGREGRGGGRDCRQTDGGSHDPGRPGVLEHATSSG